MLEYHVIIASNHSFNGKVRDLINKSENILADIANSKYKDSILESTIDLTQSSNTEIVFKNVKATSLEDIKEHLYYIGSLYNSDITCAYINVPELDYCGYYEVVSGDDYCDDRDFETEINRQYYYDEDYQNEYIPEQVLDAFYVKYFSYSEKKKINLPG
jgi:hypothetical protein